MIGRPKVGLIGLGFFGSRHPRVYKDHDAIPVLDSLAEIGTQRSANFDAAMKLQNPRRIVEYDRPAWPIAGYTEEPH